MPTEAVALLKLEHLSREAVLLLEPESVQQLGMQEALLEWQAQFVLEFAPHSVLEGEE